MAEDGESLESWLNKATSPSNTHQHWDFIMAFCDQLNKELEGPQISVKLLVHKIQSPQEWEALQALTVLDACTKNCGRRFHKEVGKFRFLNELVKVISPKFVGDKVSERVKAKVVAMLYSWTVSLPEEAKIREAYHMLKSQGVVLADPEMPLDATLTPSPSTRPTNPVFDDEKKSKRLAGLLRSKKPADLQEANRLIRNMVKEDEVRIQKTTKQKNTLEAANNSVKLLHEMLAHFSPEGSTDGDKELLQELRDDCDKLRLTVIQLASESEDNDSSLGDILQTSDDLSHAIGSYKKIVDGQMIDGRMIDGQMIDGQMIDGQMIDGQMIDGQMIDGRMEAAKQKGTGSAQNSDILINLLDVGPEHGGPVPGAPPTQPWGLPGHSCPPAPRSLLDEDLLSFAGFNEPAASKLAADGRSFYSPSSQTSNEDVALVDISWSSAPVCSSPLLLPDLLSPPTSAVATTFAWPGASTPSPPAASALLPHPPTPVLTTAAPPAPRSVSLAPVPPPQVSSPPGASHTPLASFNQSLKELSFLDLGSSTRDLQATPTAAPATGHASAPVRPTAPLVPLTQPTSTGGRASSLSDVFVPLSAIEPSRMCPVTECDTNGIRFLLHVASDSPAGRPDVSVMVASIVSTAPLPATDVVLQAAVPRMMKVRLQQPSGRELAPFNPTHPPAAITQVMLLANPLKKKVRLRYKLTFSLGARSYTEVGEVNQFPTTDSLAL